MTAVRNMLAKYRALAPMGRSGIVALLAAALISPLGLRWALVPLGVFVAQCMVAPFIPSSSFFLPVVSRGKNGRKGVALTFDDGPDPETTPELLRLLRKYRAHATFFVTGSRVDRYPQLAKEILEQGHSLANHSFHHDPLGAFRGVRTMRAEIEATQQTLQNLGVSPLAYRPPMGITCPQLRPVMQQEGMFVVNFSCRAWDGGNRRIRNLSQSLVKRVCANDIILLHENLPRSSSFRQWSAEMERVLKGIQEKSLEVLPLAELIGRPVMAAAAKRNGVADSIRPPAACDTRETDRTSPSHKPLSDF
jgi:peptidoglycan-N-acetylglucosamine deacetylase